MAENKYPFGYSTTKLTWNEMMTKKTVNKLHSEVLRRFKALIEQAAFEGVPLGVGTGWRIQPPKKPGFAAPGNSYHEGFPADGTAGDALAIDTVPTESWDWLGANAAKFGFFTFKNVGNEPWHIQPTEVPRSRNYATKCPPLHHFDLPGESSPAPLPPMILEGTDMLIRFFVTDSKTPAAQYVTNGINYRHIPSQAAADALTLFMSSAGLDTEMQQCKKAQIGWAGAYIQDGGTPGGVNPFL